MTGDFIIDMLLEEEYLTLHREEYFRVEEVLYKKTRNKHQIDNYMYILKNIT